MISVPSLDDDESDDDNDDDNDDDGDASAWIVDLFVTSGLRHGRLLLDGEPTLSFTSDDLSLGRLRYAHNDDESLVDTIELRVTRRRRHG